MWKVGKQAGNTAKTNRSNVKLETWKLQVYIMKAEEKDLSFCMAAGTVRRCTWPTVHNYSY